LCHGRARSRPDLTDMLIVEPHDVCVPDRHLAAVLQTKARIIAAAMEVPFRMVSDLVRQRIAE